jgi:hypothetical protein
MIKDVRDLKLQDCLQIVQNISKLIENILTPQNQTLIHIAASGAGQPKKGMPGYTQFYHQVEINIPTVMTLLLALLDLQPQDDFKAQN